MTEPHPVERRNDSLGNVRRNLGLRFLAGQETRRAEGKFILGLRRGAFKLELGE